VLVVLYLPRGFAGLAHDLVDRFLARGKAPSHHAIGASDASQLAE
jgi:urea transport system permease protein